MKKNQMMIATSCFTGYMAAYVARSVLSAIMPSMTSGGVSQDILTLAASLFFFSYGIGQLVNGIAGDFIRAKIIVPLGLLVSAAVLFAFPAAIGFDNTGTAACVLWCVCGFALSMLWGPITKVVAENIPGSAGVRVMTALNISSVLGNLVAYLFCAWAAYAGMWELAFYTCGVVTILGCIAAYIFLDIPERHGELRMINSTNGEKGESSAKLKELLPVLISRGLIPILVVGAMNGILRNAVTFWTPTYISENLGASSGLSSLLSAAIPFLNIVGTYVGIFLLSKMRGDESKVNAIFFGLSAVCFVMLGYTTGLPVINLILLFAASMAMCSANNLIFSSYCLHFIDTGRESLISGGIDCACYMSTAAANGLINSLTASSGWGTVTLVWGGLAVIGIVASLVCSYMVKKADRKAARV